MSMRTVVKATRNNRCADCPPAVLACWHADDPDRGGRGNETSAAFLTRSYLTWTCKILEARLPPAASKRLRRQRKRLTRRAGGDSGKDS